MKTTILKISLIFFALAAIGGGCGQDETSSNDYVVIEDINAKVFKSAKSLDENNLPKDYDWAISTNEEYLHLQDTQIDTNILAPLNLPDEFKISGLKVKVSGKKYINRNRVLTSPYFKNGFGYAFEITAIEKLD